MVGVDKATLALRWPNNHVLHETNGWKVNVGPTLAQQSLINIKPTVGKTALDQRWPDNHVLHHANCWKDNVEPNSHTLYQTNCWRNDVGSMLAKQPWLTSNQRLERQRYTNNHEFTSNQRLERQRWPNNLALHQTNCLKYSVEPTLAQQPYILSNQRLEKQCPIHQRVIKVLTCF